MISLTAPLAACGGGGGAAGPDAPQPYYESYTTELLHADAGTIWTDHGQVTIVATDATARFGDSAYYTQARGFLQFDLSSLPLGAHVAEARLTVHQTDTLGEPGELGMPIVDHIDWPAGVPLGGAMAFGGTLSTGFGVMTSPALAIVNHPRQYVVDVTAQLNSDLADGRGTSAYRFYTPAFNNDQEIDMAILEGWHEPSQQTWKARLSIRYQP